MAGQSTQAIDDEALKAALGELSHKPRVLLIVAPYYSDIADTLETNARLVLNRVHADVLKVVVPGALEIPQALELALSEPAYGTIDAAVAIGCVIRGETSHYDIVCNNTNHWLMDVALSHGVPVGNAILTVDTHEQAAVRAAATTGNGGKGADAARAALSLIRVANPPGAQQDTTSV
ncbi:MAG: 6,7-dimethyl-8-ribityllumazine synthase [Pseudomonadota bacterium]